MTTKTQERVLKVLQRMQEMARADDDDAQMLSEALQPMLEDVLGQDGFGTEGQLDPRGDGRDGTWSMDHVQGVDD